VAAPSSSETAADLPWWKTAVVYQVYPRSFADADGDGVGDLPGVLSKVDHLADLGIDCVWMSPFYASPMHDNGYDVSDHCAVDPVFGTLDDFDALVAALHERGIRLIVDFVPNHVSSEHPWFVEAVSDPESDKRDWFIWADPAPDGGPPTNWTASFTKASTWELDERSGQYYLHLFLPEQPDVNWANPEVEAAQHDVLRFWLDRGVDGFRIDVINAIGKDPEPRDVPERMAGIDHVVLTHHETAMPLIRRIREVVDPPGVDRLVVGEVVTGDIEQQASYCGDGDGVSCTVNFVSVGASWDRDQWHLLLDGMEDAYADHDATWPSYVLSNHDNPRHRTRYGGSEARARSAALLLLTVRGTPSLYQGEELGLEDAVIPAGTEVDPGGRDGCRAPIPWTVEAPHGWGPEPWLPFPPEAGPRSVAAQRGDSSSVLALYQALLAARKASPALQHGSLELLARTDLVLAYRRVAGDDERVIAVNFADEPADVTDLTGTVVVGSNGLGAGHAFGGRLGPDEAVLLQP
jgi:alpha-glucosidase